MALILVNTWQNALRYRISACNSMIIDFFILFALYNSFVADRTASFEIMHGKTKSRICDRLIIDNDDNLAANRP